MASIRNLANGKSGLKEESKAKPIINVSGYYCFLQLGNDTVTVVVEPNLGNLAIFFKHEQTINLSAWDVNEPVEIFLKPKPNYLFPKQATLIRGRLVNVDNDEGIKDAMFKAVYVGVPINNGTEAETLSETRSDQQGEFVLFLKQIRFKDNKKPPIKDIQITIIRATFEKMVLVEGETLTEGSALNIGNIKFP